MIKKDIVAIIGIKALNLFVEKIFDFLEIYNIGFMKHDHRFCQ